MSALNDLAAQAAPERIFIFVAPYSTVHVAAFDREDQIGMRAGQLAAILRVIPVGNHSAPMISLAGRLADELKAQSNRDALVADQLAELLLRAQCQDGPCDLLWLAQQLADEISELVDVIVRNENEGGPA
ncbi:hypothetical protein HHL21_12040 [Massilia sp. RP-1-19]|uniref:Uncharacterized protein n=1 Tax=Massilia polaris TaxID=2728846 RepID=A0A848HL76_9BURK|nr:hypothetical protein [Massilia polaris]NML61797.1 hypothetical protein [Massilia polaris]